MGLSQMQQVIFPLWQRGIEGDFAALYKLFRHSGSREATVRNLEKTLLTGYRITTESCPV
jgi:hypothetical protein